MGWTDYVYYKLRSLGVDKPLRPAVNFGAGFALADNATTEATDVAYSPSAEETCALTGSQDDVPLASPSSLPLTIVRVTNAGGLTIQGLTGGVARREVLLINVSGATLTLVHEGTGTSANRLILVGAANKTIADQGAARIVYDSTSARWRLASRET